MSTPVTTVEIESVEGTCDPRAARLWKALRGPTCATSHPAICLIARETDSHQMVGVAQYFRTFPPEEGCGAIVVTPRAHRAPVAAALLDRMVEHAAQNGIRVLGTIVDDQDLVTMELLRSARLPVRVSRMNGRLYVEIDVFHAVCGTALPDDSPS